MQLDRTIFQRTTKIRIRCARKELFNREAFDTSEVS